MSLRDAGRGEGEGGRGQFPFGLLGLRINECARVANNFARYLAIFDPLLFSPRVNFSFLVNYG